MNYRALGRTGLTVSQLGFGAMRLPMKGDRVDRDLAVPMIHRAFELGVTYIDTAVGYCNQDSQRAVGDALKGWRDKIVVSTKNPYYGDDEKAWWKNLEDSLQRLGVEHIDIYNHHGINAGSMAVVESRVGAWMRAARDRGLVKHICCSFHDSNATLRRLVDTGYPEVITLQYNLLDRQLTDGIAYAREKGIGIVVMGPVGGGRLGVSSAVLGDIVPGVARVPELALRFVLSNPNVSVALSGMSTMEQVEENVAIASQDVALSAGDAGRLDEHLSRLKGMGDLYCSGCGYCAPCPSKVDVPQVFRLYNEARVWGLWDHSRRVYRDLVEHGRSADECTECRTCLGKCPQKLDIPARLAEAHQALMQVD